MSRIVESCPLTRFDGDLLWLHSAVDCAVTWLQNQNVAVEAFAKRTNQAWECNPAYYGPWPIPSWGNWGHKMVVVVVSALLSS